MRVLGFSIPLFVLLIGVYLIGVKYPSLGVKVLGQAARVAS